MKLIIDLNDKEDVEKAFEMLVNTREMKTGNTIIYNDPVINDTGDNKKAAFEPLPGITYSKCPKCLEIAFDGQTCNKCGYNDDAVKATNREMSEREKIKQELKELTGQDYSTSKMGTDKLKKLLEKAKHMPEDSNSDSSINPFAENTEQGDVDPFASVFENEKPIVKDLVYARALAMRLRDTLTEATVYTIFEKIGGSKQMSVIEKDGKLPAVIAMMEVFDAMDTYIKSQPEKGAASKKALEIVQKSTGAKSPWQVPLEKTDQLIQEFEKLKKG